MKKALRKEALTLFSKEAIEKLRKDRFSGRLFVCWENGIINDFNLKTNIRLFIGNRRDDFFIDEI
jgi:hypothetical protein